MNPNRVFLLIVFLFFVHRAGAYVIQKAEIQANGGIGLQWTDLGAGYRYTVNACSSLSTGVWELAPPVGQWPSSTNKWNSPLPATNGAQFFRVQSLAPGEPYVFIVNTTADVLDGQDGLLSLRAAIRAANASAGADVIQLPAGLFRLALGELDITENLVVNGAGADHTIVDGGRLGRVFAASGNVDFHDLTIQGGMATNGAGGGGVYVSYTATGTRVRFYNCVIQGNTAGAASAGQGGGIYGETNTQTCLYQSRVNNNQADQAGGGLYIAGGGFALTGTTVAGNTAGMGGGVGSYLATGQIVNSTISGNTAQTGGGIFQGGAGGDGSLSLANSTVSSNLAFDEGGGIYALADVVLSQCTICFNTTGGPGGGLDNAGAGMVVVAGTIVAGHGAYDIKGNITSLDYNLIQNQTGGTVTGPQTNSLYGTDPQLSPLADNGGATWTHALLPGSPAIDAGGAVQGNSYDQRDWAFIRSVRITSNATDIGAYEFNPVVDFNGTNSGFNSAMIFPFGTTQTNLTGPAVRVFDNGTNLSAMTLILTVRPDGTNESLAVSGSLPAGLIVSEPYDSASGRLVLSGAARAGTYAEALARIVYRNTSSAPSPADRIVWVQASQVSGGATGVGTPTLVHISVQDAPTAGFGNALRLDGTQSLSANMVPNGLGGASGLSFGAWVNLQTNGTGARAILSFADSTNAPLMYLAYDYAGGRFYYWDRSALQVLGSGTFAPGTWHAVMVTINPTAQAGILYVDGAVQASFTTATALPQPGQHFAIGNDLDSASGLEPFAGFMDEVSVWRVPLTQAMIRKGIQGLLHVDATWSFAMISDLHSPTDSVNPATVLVANEVARRTPKAVLIAGDLVEGGENKNANDIYKAHTNLWTALQPILALDIPIRAVPGNHDYWGASAVTVSNGWQADVVTKLALPMNGPSDERGRTHYYQYRNAFFVGLNQWEYDGGTPPVHGDRNGVLKAEPNNLAWLTNALALNPAPHLFSYGHQPMFDDGLLDPTQVSNRTDFLDCLGAAGSGVYFAGHLHNHFSALAESASGSFLQQIVAAPAGGKLNSSSVTTYGNSDQAAYEYSGYGTPSFCLITLAGHATKLETYFAHGSGWALASTIAVWDDAQIMNQPYDPGTGLVAYWHFDDAAGSPTAADVTGINDLSLSPGSILVPSTLCPIYTVTTLGTVSGSVFGTVNGLAGLTYKVTQPPAQGSLTSFNPSTGAFTYVPNAGWAGADSFAYRASADGGSTWSARPGTIQFSASP